MFVSVLSLFSVLSVVGAALTAEKRAELEALPKVPLPVIKYADLVTQDTEAAQALVEHFTTLGGAQITGIPRFSLSRKRALEDLAECLSEEQEAPAVRMADGARRVSTGAASHGGEAQKMQSVCGEAAGRLRASVDAAMSLVFSLLDSAAHAQNSNSKYNDKYSDKSSDGKREREAALLMGPHYEGFRSLMSAGEHLEHLHSYFAPDKRSEDDNINNNVSNNEDSEGWATLDLHVDSGLLIAMTAGLYAGAAPSAASGLYVTLADGSRAQAQVQEDALVVLLGDGATHWLRPVLGRPLRALPHALVADLPAGSSASRSWYGKMYLPPRDALIPGTGTGYGPGSEDLSFAQYHALQSAHAAPLDGSHTSSEAQSQSALRSLLPAACGGELGGRYLLTVASSCPADQIWCWARCMDASALSCGSEAVCWDSKAKQPIDGDQHCMETGVPGGYCYPMCLNGTAYNSTFSGYCYGEGTSMYMTGFVSAVQEGSGNFECVNLLWPEWTLDSRVKLGFACLGVFLGCVLIQFLTKLRANLKIEHALVKRGVNTLLFGVQITLSYFAMLVAMTYNVELFCMICTGLTVGYAIFHSDNSQAAQSEPCCAEDNPLFGNDKVKKEGDCCAASAVQFA